MKKAIAIISILGMLAATSAAFAVEFPTFPMSFWGEITVNGDPAPVDSVIRAYYGSELAGAVTVQEAGIYGYIDSIKQKLIIGEGSGEISFTVQSSSLNDGDEITGESHPGFDSGITENKNFSFSFTIPSSGGGGGGPVGGYNPGPTPTPSPTTQPLGGAVGIADSTNLSVYNLTEGDMISAQGSWDPDIYIVNEHAYKRLFLNPVIFEFYGHLGGWGAVGSITPEGRDAFPTTQLFRNCETDAEEVYAVEVTGEDTATLHWINMSGGEAVAEDPDFFKKVFCINNLEFNWYTESGVAYTSLAQVPAYSR